MVLEQILERAKKLNYLGKPPVNDHILNAEGFLAIISKYQPNSGRCKLIDLGSGGGVPALLLIERLPDATAVLIERKQKRANFLLWALEVLGIDTRTEVVCAEAEKVARNPKYEFSADIVTARSFAPPAVTAECACRLLKNGGFLVVSEPPEPRKRWESEALEETGLIPIARYQEKNGTFQVLQRNNTPSSRLPRRPGITRKRPLW
tara:strand:- start:3644 stop:4261 length:618 start_codon:yes stop_codon:yes gene_type:complete